MPKLYFLLGLGLLGLFAFLLWKALHANVTMTSTFAGRCPIQEGVAVGEVALLACSSCRIPPLLSYKERLLSPLFSASRRSFTLSLPHSKVSFALGH